MITDRKSSKITRTAGILGLALTLLIVALAANTRSPEEATAETTTTTVTWGPYTLQPATESGPWSTNNGLDIGVQLPCTDCYITEIIPELVLEDGTTSANFNNKTMLHHMVLFNGSRSDATCSGSIWDLLGERIFASGNERTTFSMPPGYGYYNGAGEYWTVLHDIMNMDTAPVEKIVYLKFTFTYKAATEDVKPVTPVWLDVNNCASSEYPVPLGYDDEHWDWTSTLEGDVVSIGGHQHNWGLNIASELVESGEYFCDSLSGYASGSSFAPISVSPLGEGHYGTANELMPGDPAYAGRIEDMTGCSPMFRITPGDTIRLHSQYNSTAAQPDVMGIMVAYVHETTEPPNPDDDGDGYSDIVEAGRPLCGDGRNEDDFEDSVVDDGCPGGPAQVGAFSEGEFNIGSDPLMPCGTSDWPSDFVTGGALDSTDMVTITDITSFLAPVRRFQSSPGDAEYDSRWDLKPGRTAFADWIALDDLTALLAGPTGSPPMFGGAKAFGGPLCQWPE